MYKYQINPLLRRAQSQKDNENVIDKLTTHFANRQSIGLSTQIEGSAIGKREVYNPPGMQMGRKADITLQRAKQQETSAFRVKEKYNIAKAGDEIRRKAGAEPKERSRIGKPRGRPLRQSTRQATTTPQSELTSKRREMLQRVETVSTPIYEATRIQIPQIEMSLRPDRPSVFPSSREKSKVKIKITDSDEGPKKLTADPVAILPPMPTPPKLRVGPTTAREVNKPLYEATKRENPLPKPRPVKKKARVVSKQLQEAKKKTQTILPTPRPIKKKARVVSKQLQEATRKTQPKQKAVKTKPKKKIDRPTPNVRKQRDTRAKKIKQVQRQGKGGSAPKPLKGKGKKAKGQKKGRIRGEQTAPIAKQVKSTY